jgi:hypothetical protein
MSAASPKIPDTKFQDKAADKGQEPSMEEILASIRRIIADDQATKPTEALPEPEPDDVLDLAEVAQPVARPRAVVPEPRLRPRRPRRHRRSRRSSPRHGRASRSRSSYRRPWSRRRRMPA